MNSSGNSAGVEVELALQQQVDETVADGREAEQHRGDEQAAEARRAAGRTPRAGGRARLPAPPAPRAGSRTNSTITPTPSDAKQNETRNSESNAIGATASSPKATSGPIMRAGGVERAVHAERGAEVLLGRGQRDHRVARRGADALAGAVEHDDRADRGERAADRREQPSLQIAESP